jgi:N-acetylglucosaminyldiphosphoundecaprenol N-acetyl-beta-D-mannosaminyltransferase
VLEHVDFASLAQTLGDRRLLPLIGTRALEAGGELCPPRFATTVGAALTASRARGLGVEGETRRAVARLAEHDIRALPLKGPLLAAEVHGDIGLRETDDVDLLVPAARLHDAARILGGAATPTDPLRRNGLPDLHLGLLRPDRPDVELHWRVHWYEREFSDDMLANATAGPDGLLRARPEDLAASILLFYGRDGFHGIRHAADAAAWWDRHATALPDGFLEDHARRYPALAPALVAAATVLEHVTGTPALAWLGDAPRGGRRTEAAMRLADWTQAGGDRDQLAANISLAGVLLGPAGSVPASLRRELVPRRGAAVPHAVKMLGRYAAALWRVRGGRWWIEVPEGEPARRVELLRMPLDRVSEAEAIGSVIGALDSGRGGWVITPNLECLRQFTRAPDVARMFDEADLVVADGMPLTWAARLAGTPLPARVAGSDLVWSLTAEASMHGRSIFLLGGAPGVSERAAQVMRANYPGMRIAGVHSPPYGFEDDPAELERIRALLRDSEPDVVYVALGFPRQERLIRQLRGELPNAWFIGVGISFSFLSGDVARAPDWLQRIGLEWAHRLASEPRRLARRYLVYDLPFAARLGLHVLWRRVTRRSPPLPLPERSESQRVVFTHGAVERRRAEELAALLRELE